MEKIKNLFSHSLSSLISFVKGVPQGTVSVAQSRQVRFGGISFVSLLLIIGILVLVNLMVKNSGIRWDLTKNKVYSLSPETVKVLKNVKEEVKVLVFITNENEVAEQRDQIRKLLDEYSVRNPKIKYQFVDPYAQQRLALQYGIQRQGTVVFTAGSKVEQTTNTTEQDFTSALIKLQNPNKIKVVFWTGSGEKDPDDMTVDGYSEVKASLERLNYIVSKQNPSQDPRVATDTGVLIVAGPRAPYVSRYADAIDAYLNQGGRVLFLFELLQNFQQTGLEGVLSKYGISIKQGGVIDTEIFFRNPGIPGVERYPSHQITESLGQTVFLGPIEVKPADTIPDTMLVQSIVKTSAKSWLETGMDQTPTLNTQAGDVAGPISIGVAMNYASPGKDTTKATRIVALGDADSGSNLVVQYSPQKDFVVPGSLDLIINSVNWLAAQENLISIAPKDTTNPTFSPTEQQLRQIQYFVMGIIPATFLLIAGLVWRRRQRMKA